jgi:6-phosphofructokinase 2
VTVPVGSRSGAALDPDPSRTAGNVDVTTRNPKILTLTLNPALDLSTSVEEFRSQDKLRCESPIAEPGGGGINVARAIRRLGGATTAIHTSGGDTGRTLASLLLQEGVEARAIRIRGITRESLAVAERASGKLLRFVLPGPELARAEWEQCLTTVLEHSAGGAMVVASGSLPPGVPDDFYGRLARTLRSDGGRLLLDTSGRALAGALKEGVYLVKPDFRELQELAGSELARDEERADFAAGLVADGSAEIVVATLKAEGALVVTAEGRKLIRAPKIDRLASAVGAGDSFMAALALSLARGDQVVDAARRGAAAAAAALLTPGSELFRSDDVERLYAEMGPPRHSD